MVTKHNTEGPTVRADRLAAALMEGLPVTERRLDLAGVSTSVLEGGDGPPIVLLHGQGAFAQAWGPVIPDLVVSHRVVAPDLPGLGRSEVRTGSLDAPGVLAWLGDLIAQTCAQPPTLVGISLGGSLAARFAIQHADRVRQIVLVDSGSLGLIRPAPGALFALIRYLRRPSPATNERLFRYVVADPERIRARMGDRWAAFQAYHIDRMSQPSVRGANRQLLMRIGNRRISPDQLGKIGVPVALIWGRNDRIMRFRIAEKASARFGWPLYPIDDCGHFSIADRPEAFLEALRAAMAAPIRRPGTSPRIES
jgi:pimeloyl-ACP methyl ester carboxylesterase